MKRSSALHLGLQGRMLLAFLCSSLATLVVALVGLFAIRALSGNLNEVGHRRMVASEEMLKASTKIHDLQTLLREALSYTIASAERVRLDNEISAARADYRAAAEKAKPLLDEDELKKLELFSNQAKEWAATNDQIRAKMRTIAENKIDSPLTLQSQFEGFRADHLQLIATAQKQLAKGETYSGSTDHTACRFGRWLGSYQTENTALRTAMQRAVDPHQKLHATIKEFQQMLKDGQSAEAKKLLETAMVPSVDATVAMLKELQAEPTAAIAALDEMNRLAREVSGPQSQKALKTIDEIVEEVNQQAQESVTAADKLATTAKTTSLVATVVGTLCAILLGLYVARRIARQLRNVAGDLDGCSDQTASVAAQIATTSQNLAASASEQASSLEETSAALEELSGTTNQNAERARSANDRAAAARASVERGATQMRELQAAMTSIQESSSEITKIVKTIDEIAFQTNLLALNAAVEAARAGEAGAGFAVVADEVRSLAHRSATAAKETTTLVDNARQRSERGAALAGDVSKNLEEILTETRTVDSLVSGIAAASNEQSVGVDQIKKAASQLDQLVQANAATAEENASAAEELQGQTAGMHGMVQTLLQIVNGSGSHIPSTEPAPEPTRSFASKAAVRKLAVR
ncbi:MAG: methyl-accepting chemotaxis protein [Nibricoccus sp.]